MSSQPESHQVHGHSTLLARFLWAMIGPIALVSAMVPVGKTPYGLSLWDGVFASIMGLMILGRYLEQRSGHGTTLYSEPSTWAHFRSYAIKVVLVGVALWIIAKAGGRYFGM